MPFQSLPHAINRVFVPPIKTQGIKTKLVNFITTNVRWEGDGRWIEPFLGSGVVAFNVQPERAILSDANPHIINLYKQIYNGSITPGMVRGYLQTEGDELKRIGAEHYYAIRERFNKTGDSLDFLFLNRAGFNGMIRFNRKGKLNVPFCRKPDRFRGAYITKIVNQVRNIAEIMSGKDWVFHTQDWEQTLAEARYGDFVYLDPPYIGRHTDYYTQWSDENAVKLSEIARNLPCGFALSMWKRNRYRENEHISRHWAWATMRTTAHYYHLGSFEELRNEVEEALLIQPGYEAHSPVFEIIPPQQMAFPLNVPHML
jgi:DNA adenine methylase